MPAIDNHSEYETFRDHSEKSNIYFALTPKNMKKGKAEERDITIA